MVNVLQARIRKLLIVRRSLGTLITKNFLALSTMVIRSRIKYCAQALRHYEWLGTMPNRVSDYNVREPARQLV